MVFVFFQGKLTYSLSVCLSVCLTVSLYLSLSLCAREILLFSLMVFDVTSLDRMPLLLLILILVMNKKKRSRRGQINQGTIKSFPKTGVYGWQKIDDF